MVHRHISNTYGLHTRFASTLYMPMDMHIGMVSLYAGMPSLDMLHYPQADRQLGRLPIEASVIPSLLCPIDGYQHSR